MRPQELKLTSRQKSLRSRILGDSIPVTNLGPFGGSSDDSLNLEYEGGSEYDNYDFNRFLIYFFGIV